MEKAAKDGSFGDHPTNIKPKPLGDRPGITFDILKGETPFTCWAVYFNDDAAIVMSVRKNAGVPAAIEKEFFDSLRFGVDPPKKEGNPGGPGAPPGRPGVPPGGPGGPGGGAPPGKID
jgi:hypothetical protein